MKKIIYILFALISFVACTRDNGPAGKAENPLSECLCQETVRAGEEGIIQWNGFADGDKLALVAEDGIRYPLDIKVLTASGLIFTVPSDVPAGEYSLVLQRVDETELGRILVREPLCPVSGVKVPVQASCGDQIDITGLGFEPGCTIVFVHEDGTEYALDTELTYSGVSVTIPDDMPEGNFSVYLVQGGTSWLLSASFEVCQAVVIKELMEIRYFYPYTGNDMMMLSWTVGRVEPMTLTAAEYLVSDGEMTMNAYDSYVADGENRFVLDHDGLEISNAVDMSYQRYADGRVTSSDVLFYGKKTPTVVGWTYDADGFLTSIYSPTAVLRSMEYEDGNLTVFRQTRFEYKEPSLVNAVYAGDVVWGYMAVQEYMDPYVYVPYLLGWYDCSSKMLPTALIMPSPTGSGELACALEYEFDEDGYVVKMSWKEGSSPHWIDYIYE